LAGKTSRQTALYPAQPTPHVFPNAFRARTLLVKPGFPFGVLLQGTVGQTDQPFGRKAIAEEIESSFDLSDKGLVGVLFHTEFIQHPIHVPHRSAEFPPGGRENHPVVHEAGVVQTVGLLKAIINLVQIQCTHQRAERTAQRDATLGRAPQPAVIDRAVKITFQQLQHTGVVDMPLELLAQDLRVDAGVIAPHVRAEDKRELLHLLTHFAYSRLGPTPTDQMEALLGQLRTQEFGQGDGYGLQH